MKCICCDFNITTMEDGLNEEEAVFSVLERRVGNRIVYVKAGNRMWLGGSVGEISAGFGSNLDGSEFVIGICDNCITAKIEDGTIAYIGNYMIRTEEVEKDILEKRIKWRRINNLNQIT